MPFIISRVNVDVSSEQEKKIKTSVGRAIELVPGKTEEYLMMIFENNSHIWLRGKNFEPSAYIEMKIFGNESHHGYNALTAEITKIYNETLNINPNNIYVLYDDIHTWGVSGFTFERGRF